MGKENTPPRDYGLYNTLPTSVLQNESWWSEVFEDQDPQRKVSMYDEDVHNLRSIKTEFLAIVYNDALTSEVALSCEPTMVVRTQPTLSPGYSAKLAEAMALSPSSFRKRYRSSYETPSSSSSPTSSPAIPLRKIYRGTSKLMEDTKTEGTKSEDEDTDSKDEETAPEGQQPHAILTEDEPLGLGYRAARCCALERVRDIVPSTYE
ncbi:hypothetical protein Tco_0717806, partial [Tanacetum coccineum]